MGARFQVHSVFGPFHIKPLPRTRAVAAFFMLTICFAFCPLVGAEMPAESFETVSPRVFLLDAEVLAATRRRIQAGDEALKPALTRLRKEADAALTAGP